MHRDLPKNSKMQGNLSYFLNVIAYIVEQVMNLKHPQKLHQMNEIPSKWYIQSEKVFPRVIILETFKITYK